MGLLRSGLLLVLDCLFGVDSFVYFLEELIILLLFFFAAVDILEVDDLEDDVVDPIVVFQLLLIGYFDGLNRVY